MTLIQRSRWRPTTNRAEDVTRRPGWRDPSPELRRLMYQSVRPVI